MPSLVLLVFVGLAAVSASASQRIGPDQESNANTDYVLGPDDQIVIRALDAEEISEKPVLIGTSGDISLPMVGRLRASGLTTQQIRNRNQIPTEVLHSRAAGFR